MKKRILFPCGLRMQQPNAYYVKLLFNTAGFAVCGYERIERIASTSASTFCDHVVSTYYAYLNSPSVYCISDIAQRSTRQLIHENNQISTDIIKSGKHTTILRNKSKNSHLTLRLRNQTGFRYQQPVEYIYIYVFRVET